MDSKGFLRDLFLAAAEASHTPPPPPRNPLDELIEAAMMKRLADIGLPRDALAGMDKHDMRQVFERLAGNPSMHERVRYGQY